MTPTLRFELVDNVLLIIHSDNEPDPRDWDAFLELYARSIDHLFGVLVFSPGPGPDNAQRRRIAKINQPRAAPIAVLTPSRLARGIVAALSWFDIPIKAFDVDGFERALDYLHLHGATRSSVARAYELLYQAVFPVTGAKQRA